MKKFLCGFLIGAMIFSMIGVFAASYVANPVDFKVLVNGKEFVSDPPALEVNGRTYLPLRAMGEALGVPVTWNEELRQAEVGTSVNSDNKESKSYYYDGYKTYSERDDVIDYGVFADIEPVDRQTQGDYIVYRYDFTASSDKYSEYSNIINENAFKVTAMQGTKFFDNEMSSNYYGVVNEAKDGTFKNFIYGSYMGRDLKFYVVIVLEK